MANDAPVGVLDLRSVFGVEARIVTSAASTAGEYVEMDCTVWPGSGTMVHYHPGQVEVYDVREGTLEVLRDGGWRPIPAGESMTIPAGAVHAFRNRTGEPVRFLNRHTPALGFEDHLVTLHRLASAGKVRGTSDLRSLIHMSMSAVEHRPDVPVKPPFWLIRLLAFMGRRLGYSIRE
jgi:mannose-6-phosphate isomerase-like protein (cupin superfamily)